VSEKVRYFQHPGGAVSELTATEPVIMPEGTREITAKTYERKLSELQTKAQDQAAQLDKEGLRQRQSDYEALKALGLPEESARRMSQYHEEPEPEGGAEGSA